MTTATESSDRRRREVDIPERYRTLLGRPELADADIAEMRANLRRIAETLCEHVWGKPFY